MLATHGALAHVLGRAVSVQETTGLLRDAVWQRGRLIDGVASDIWQAALDRLGGCGRQQGGSAQSPAAPSTPADAALRIRFMILLVSKF